jgi:hypothetical protein
LTVSSSTISSDETMRQPTLLTGLGHTMNHPLWVCSRRICSNRPSGSRRKSLYQRPGYPPSGEDDPQLVPGTLPGRDDLALTFKVNTGTLIGHIKPNQKPKGETTTIVSLPDPDADWQKLIS